MSFKLDSVLEKDCVNLGSLKFCQLLLMNDKQFPWFILVPRREEVREVYQLDRNDQISLLIESNLIAKMLETLFTPDKLNIATIGNIVPQLHMHHIARFKNDPCWPKPVWGQKPSVPYREAEIDELKQRVREFLGGNLVT